MSINLYTLTSGLHTEVLSDPMNERFIKEIEQSSGLRFTYKGELSKAAANCCNCQGITIFYVRTGGTEGIFKSIFHSDGFLSLFFPESGALLLTSGLSNSLAAAMEILSFLRQRSTCGEILHGSPEAISARIIELSSTRDSDDSEHVGEGNNFIKTLENCGKLLEGSRLGVIGRPSDWLISSNVDYSYAKEKLGCELIDIPINEVIDLFNNRNFNIGIVDKLCNNPANFNAIDENTTNGKPQNNENSVHNSQTIINEAEIEKAQRVYCCLKEIVRKYELTGLTLRCFDLLDSIRTTGCLALAKFNAEGITASCEGDIPAMISMELARKLCGTPGFQVNLSKIDGDTLLFAHCSVPLNIVERYSYNTHFESGIGVAVHGEFKEGPVSIFKVGADLKHFITIAGEIIGNQYKPGLCRTQVLVKAPGTAEYLLKSPLGNHHIIVPGHLSLE